MNEADMKWIRSLTGKDRIRDEDIKPIGPYQYPTNPTHNIREPTEEELDAYFKD